MCTGCYLEFKENGCQDIFNDKVKRALELINAVYDAPNGDVGGLMHCELDDWNIEDQFFEDELKNWADYGDEEYKTNLECFEHMKSMSLAERNTALAIHWGVLEWSED